jgi:DNA replication regulator SLD3
MLVIARLDDGKTIYAAERESRGLYVLCKLGPWIDLDKLCVDAVVSRHQPKHTTRMGNGESTQLQSNVVRNETTPESSKYSKRKRLAIEAIQSMVKRPTGEISSASQIVTPVDQPESSIAPQAHTQQEMVERDVTEILMPQPMATDILENIRSQYLETLYLSKASLGYFAKGPLSRARAAFHLDYDSTLDMSDLITFLESLILPTNVLDKKYKYGVPEIVSSLVTGDDSADEFEKTKIDHKKRAKKLKLGKNGLYHTENTYLRRWWATYDDDTEPGVPGGSKDELERKRVAQLRIRETQLQMIVILEALALQPLATPRLDQNEDLPSSGVKHEAIEGKKDTKSKARKIRDLPELIDVHVDRLCIWQSVVAEEGRSAAESGDNGDGVGSGSDLVNANRHAADVLREFCVEVIVPFFSARLPDHCGAISRKLGGPVVSSPPARPKLAKSSTISGVLSRPGAVTKRPAPVKARRSLQRVLTDERHSRSGSRGPSGAISLMRSATAPSIPGLKREASETPSLSSIPSLDSQAMHVNRGGIMKSKKFSQRQVDLSSMTGVTAPKIKKANIEAELKDAIIALKRPNRQLAGQQQVEIAEMRNSMSTSHPRKSKKPVRNPLFQGVQILATPKGNRRKDVEVNSLPMLAPDLERDYESHVMLPSSGLRIPQSVARFANARSSGNSSTCKATPIQSRFEDISASAVQGTPSRGQRQSRLSDSFGGEGREYESRIPLSSPLQAREGGRQNMLGVPGLPAKELSSLCTPTKLRKVQATPVKQASGINLENEDPYFTVMLTPLPGGKHKGMEEDVCKPHVKSGDGDSIYKSLGWDDYDELG